MSNEENGLAPRVQEPLTGRERFLRTVRGQPVDRAMNVEIGLWGQTLERWHQEGLPADIHLDSLRGLFHGGEYFGLDRMEWFPISCAPIPPFAHEVYEEDERCIVYRDGHGIVRKALKEGAVGGTRLSMDQYLRHPVTCREDFLELKKRYDPGSPARYPLWWADQVRILKGRDYPLVLGQDDFGFYWKLREFMGTEALSYAFYDQPALIEEMVEFLTDFFIETMHRALHDIEFDLFIFSEDLAGKGGPLISPDLFRRFMLPAYRRIVDFVRRHGVQSVWVGSDGYFVQLLPLLMDVGVDGEGPTEVAAGMDPLMLRREFPGLVIAGGIDKRELAKDRAAIERELFGKLPQLLERGRYIPYADHTIPPDVSLGNFLHYLEVRKRIIEEYA